jgi:hypothetical protein
MTTQSVSNARFRLSASSTIGMLGLEMAHIKGLPVARGLNLLLLLLPPPIISSDQAYNFQEPGAVCISQGYLSKSGIAGGLS